MRKYKLVLLSLFHISSVFGQENSKFEFGMDSLIMNVGESKEITIKLLDENGKLAQNPFYVFGERKTLSVFPRISDSTGIASVTLKAHKPGRLSLSTRTITVKREDRITANLIINVPYPPLDRIVFNQRPSKLYSGTSTPLSVVVFDEADLKRSELNVKLTSSNKKVAEFDILGNLETKKSGSTTISARVENLKESFKISVVKNPARKVTLSLDKEEIRTGDVISLNAKALNRSGRIINDIPITYSYLGQANYGEFGLPAAGLITDDGRFVAETAGLYTLIASSNGYSAQKTIKVVQRDVKKQVKLVGHGLISDVLTGDLWVWAGVDEHEGKDFAEQAHGVLMVKPISGM